MGFSEILMVDVEAVRETSLWVHWPGAVLPAGQRRDDTMLVPVPVVARRNPPVALLVDRDASAAHETPQGVPPQRLRFCKPAHRRSTRRRIRSLFSADVRPASCARAPAPAATSPPRRPRATAWGFFAFAAISSSLHYRFPIVKGSGNALR